MYDLGAKLSLLSCPHDGSEQPRFHPQEANSAFSGENWPSTSVKRTVTVRGEEVAHGADPPVHALAGPGDPYPRPGG